MSTDPAAIAEDFSAHRFANTYEFIAPGARWVAVGQTIIEGRDAIITACETTTAHLATVTTEFRRFLVIGGVIGGVVAGNGAVAVDVVGRYTDAEGNATTVSSCDIYEFDAGRLVLITSYTVQLDG